MKYTVNDTATIRPASALPFIVGGALVVLFVWAGFWQAGKAGTKRDEAEAFLRADGGYRLFTDGNEVRPFEAVRVRGTWLDGRQIILDNIIEKNRVGHYVLTPVETGADEPLLIVNRGFVPLDQDGIDAEDVGIEKPAAEVFGRIGRLPRPGFRMGQAIPESSSWPVHAVFPVYEDLEIALGRPVQPFVVLLDPGEPAGFERNWQPQGISAARHTAYAVQWFGMAVVLTGLLVWHGRKRSFEND